jgi:hypothetical protein
LGAGERLGSAWAAPRGAAPLTMFVNNNKFFMKINLDFSTKMSDK